MKRLLLLMSLVSVFAFEGIAEAMHWEGDGGSGIGDFEMPANWTEGKVPGAADLACINNTALLNKNFVVTLNSDVTNETVSIVVPAPEYETLFVMNQHVWTATSKLTAWEAFGGCLTFTNGTFRTKESNFSPGYGGLVTNVIVSMKDVIYETETAKFGACTASFEGSRLHASGSLSVGANGELVNVNSAFRLNGTVIVGIGGDGVMTLNGGSTHIFNWSAIGTSTSAGHLTVTGGSNTFGDISSGTTFTVASSGKGSLLVGGGTNHVGGSGMIGNVAGSVGEMNLTNGLWVIGRFFTVGQAGSGALNISGGELRFRNTSDPLLAVGRAANGSGKVTVSGGLLDVNGRVWLGGDAGSTAQLTLSGNGILRTKTIMERDGLCLFSQAIFDGGTLQAAAAGTLIQALDDVRLTANGMVVDTAGYDVSVVPMLQNAEGEAGGITKKGTGELTLTGIRTATGPVSVLGGTLVVNGNIAVSAGISRIDGTLSLASGKRLIVEAGAALAGTGTVARVTLADNAVLARSKTDNAFAPLNVSDCTSNGHLTVALSGYELIDLLASLPLLKVPTATFVKPASMNLTLNGVAAPSLILKYTQSGDATILSVKHNSGTVIMVR